MSARHRVTSLRAHGLSALLLLGLSSLSPAVSAPPIDAVSPWASGPQALFSQPALLQPASGTLALSYDLAAQLTGAEPKVSAQQAAVSLAFNKWLTFALGLSAERGPLSLRVDELAQPTEERPDVRALSVGQSLRFKQGIRLGASLSHLWVTQPSEALSSGWQLQLGLSYEPSSWLRVNVSSPPLMISQALKGGELSATSMAQRLSLALRPLERLSLGAGFSPARGGGSWSVSAQLRLWRGLALEGRLLKTLNPSTALTEALTEPLTFALSWGGDWGWRGELSPAQDGGLGEAALASLRLGSQPPERQLEIDDHKLLLVIHKGEDELRRRGSLLGRAQLSTPLLKTLRALRSARSDETVSAIALLLNSSSLGWAQAEELAEEVRALVAQKKTVIAFLPSVDPTTYLVAAEASEVWLRPTSEVRLSGLLTERFYLKGLLETLKVEAEVIAIGDFKSAPEMFLREGPSEEARVAQRAILDGRHQRLLSALARRCQSHVEDCQGAQAESWLREGPYNAREAKRTGLVDRIVHAVELDRALSSSYPALTLSPAAPPPVEASGWGTPDTLAALYLVGDIGAGGALGGGGVTAAQLVPLIHSLERRDEVKGVLLRVDSPGGAITDADEMWRSLQRLALRKPLVVSMGDVAASGGYYISAPARLIYASPNSVTGSIGVFAGKANLSTALAQLGVTVHRDRRGEGGGESSLFTPWTEAQRAKIKRSMEGLYELFLERVSAGRPQLTREALLPLAGGRVWTGAQAKERGLIDQLGGQLDALKALSDITKLGDSYRLEVVAPAPPSVLDQLGGLARAQEPERASSALSSYQALAAALPQPLKGTLRLLIERPMEGLAYLPYW